MARSRWVAFGLLGLAGACLPGCSNPLGSGTTREVKEVKDGKATARAELERAVAAHGGKALARVRLARVRYRVRGDFPLPGKSADVDVTVTETCSMPQRMRKDVHGKAGGKPYDLLWIGGPDGVWSREGRGDPVVTPGPVEVYPLFHAYLALESLLDFTPGEWVPAPEAAAPGLAAVRHLGPDGITYYFDRETHLLARTSSARTETSGMRFADYRDVGGLKLYHRVTGHADGKQAFEVAIDGVQLLDRIDPGELAFPRP